MHGDDHGSGELVALDALESGSEKSNLALVERGIGSVLIGDDAGIFEHVAVEAEDADEGCLEGEIDRGLDHGGANEAAGVG